MHKPLNIVSKTTLSFSYALIIVTLFALVQEISYGDVLNTNTDNRNYLGANPPPITDYSRTHVYVDLMHQARRFGTAQEPWDEKALLGDDGWPIGDFGVFLMTAQAEVKDIAGVYKVSFNGKAKINTIASSAIVGAVKYDTNKNLTTAEVTLAPYADQLILSFTQTGVGIKNLRVIRPGYDSISPPLFTKSFLDHIARFKTIRFMDWLRTNNNPVQYWETRTTRRNVHYNSPNGVPWEDIIELANLTQKDIWINIPVFADDNYIVKLAELLKENLNNKSVIYLEYSNEVWNSQFKQYQSNIESAKNELMIGKNNVLSFDGVRDPNVWGVRRIALRIKQISDIFKQVYGPDAINRTIRPIYSSQVVNPYISEMGLKFLNDVFGNPSKFLYAMAVAPYINLGNKQTVPNLTIDDVLNELNRSSMQLSVNNHLEQNVSLATWYGLKLIAYEGGVDTFGPNSIESKKAANLDSRMLGICVDYLKNWYELGGDLFMWFNAGAGNWNTDFGAWELTTDLTIKDTPKIRCMDTILKLSPINASIRNKVPGKLDALAYVGNSPPYSEKSKNKIRYLHPRDYVDYLVMSQTSGTFDLILSTYANHSGNVVSASVNSEITKSELELAYLGWEKPVDQQPIKLNLKKGLNTLRIITQKENGGYGIQHLQLVKKN